MFSSAALRVARLSGSRRAFSLSTRSAPSSSLSAGFLPSLLGVPRASRAAAAAPAVRWRSALATAEKQGLVLQRSPLGGADSRQEKPTTPFTSALPAFSGIQVAPFSTDEGGKRRRAERRRARLRGGAPTMTKEREQVTGEPVHDLSDSSEASRRQIDAMSDGQAAYLRRVWGLAGANVGIASVGCIGGMVLGISPLISFGGSLVSILALGFGAPKGSNPALRAGLLASSALFIGSSLGPIVGASLAMDPLLLPMALGASGGIFAGATVFSLMAPEGRMLSLGGPLFGGLLVLLGCGILGMFYPHPVLQSVSLYGGLALFSVYVAYDTQVILDDYKNGMEDAVQHSLNLFLDFVNIFRRVLFMFMLTNDD